MKDSDTRGIVVLGTPRSGTTLLRRLLDGHSAIACPGETNLLSSCGRFLREERVAQGTRIGVLSGLGYAGFEESEVIDRLREFAFGFHREHADRVGKRRWAEKTAFDAFYLDEVEKLCAGHVQFLCVQRHGIDVALSLGDLCRENGGFLQELHEYVRRYPRTMEAFVRAWVDLTEGIAAFAQRHPKDALVVRYEDLVSDVDSVLRRVFEFLGEEWEEDLVARALEKKSNLGLGDWKTYRRKEIDASSADRWRSLPPAELAALAGIVNPTLVKCGYDPLPEGPDETPEEARRRYRLGLLVQGMNDNQQSD